MAGFLTYYLFGMESCDMLSDNYIHEVIKRITMLSLGLQGTICSPLILILYPKRGLSYRTASLTLRNQDTLRF